VWSNTESILFCFLENLDENENYISSWAEYFNYLSGKREFDLFDSKPEVIENWNVHVGTLSQNFYLIFGHKLMTSSTKIDFFVKIRLFLTDVIDGLNFTPSVFIIIIKKASLEVMTALLR